MDDEQAGSVKTASLFLCNHTTKLFRGVLRGIRKRFCWFKAPIAFENILHENFVLLLELRLFLNRRNCCDECIWIYPGEQP